MDLKCTLDILIVVMQRGLKNFVQEVMADYFVRFLNFWIILYIATTVAELMRLGMLQILVSRGIFRFLPILSTKFIFKEFIAHPLLIILPIAIIFFNLWGFAALYFSFTGRGVQESTLEGLKKIGSYIRYVFVASFFTFLGFLALTLPVLWAIDVFSIAPFFIAGKINYITVIPLFFLFGIPGIYLLISFSNGPFILLFEKKGVLRSLRESRTRVSKNWWNNAFILASMFLLSAILYFAIAWIMYELKMYFIHNLSYRGELALRLFIYSIPWIISSSLYDLAVYHLYIKLFAENSKTTEIKNL